MENVRITFLPNRYTIHTGGTPYLQELPHTFFTERNNRYVSRRPNDTPPHSHMLASSSMSGTTAPPSGGSSGTVNKAWLLCAHFSCDALAICPPFDVATLAVVAVASLTEALRCSNTAEASDGLSVNTCVRRRIGARGVGDYAWFFRVGGGVQGWSEGRARLSASGGTVLTVMGLSSSFLTACCLDTELTLLPEKDARRRTKQSCGQQQQKQ